MNDEEGHEDQPLDLTRRSSSVDASAGHGSDHEARTPTHGIHRPSVIKYCSPTISKSSTLSQPSPPKKPSPPAYDDIISEHFKRSLGQSHEKPSTSVDDHFAKALGDTWLRLQKSDTKEPVNGKPRDKLCTAQRIVS